MRISYGEQIRTNIVKTFSSKLQLNQIFEVQKFPGIATVEEEHTKLL